MANKNSNKAKSEAEARLRNYEAKTAQREAKAQKRKADNRLATFVGAGAIVFALVATLSHSAVFPDAVPTQTPTEIASSTNVPTAPSSATASPTPHNAQIVPKPSEAAARTWTGSMKVGSTKVSFNLDGVKAPQATANFVSLVKKGFYEGLSCHRLTTAGIYVLQCGDPKGDGSGGPGYTFGPIENAPAGDLYKTGYLAMARQSGNANSMGSQFFIVYADSTIPSDIAGGYTVLGTITKGIDGIQAIAAKGVAGGANDGAPAEPVNLTAVKVQ